MSDSDKRWTMGISGITKQAIFHRIERHKTGYALAVVALYLFLNNSLSAWSVWMESNRHGAPTIEFWEPYCWEYSSALSLLALLPWLWRWFEAIPTRVNKALRHKAIGSRVLMYFILHGLTTAVFSLGHVVLMVAGREVVYGLYGGDYVFGDWQLELWYEYRKDAWSYFDLLIVFYASKFIYARLWGEATAIHVETNNDEQSTASNALLTPSSETPHSASSPEHFLIKKLDKEYLLKVCDIEWIESAGNYVNFHSLGRIYPFRSSLLAITEQLQPLGFCRIHRGHSVNCALVDSLRFQPSGDGEVSLMCGRVLKLSRRYKNNFKTHIDEPFKRKVDRVK